MKTQVVAFCKQILLFSCRVFRPMKSIYFFAIALIAWLAVCAYFRHDPNFDPDPRILPASAVDKSIDYSNVMPADYVGPETCAECHQEEHDLWHDHPHRLMNQMASAESIKADFDHSVLELPTGTAMFTLEKGKYWMTILKDNQIFRRYLVTRTVGSRYMQYFIGKLVLGPEEKSDPQYDEHMLPFSYRFRTKRWYPRQYFDADGDEILKDGIPQVEAVDRANSVRPFTRVCMSCHNTVPYALRVLNDTLVGFQDAHVAIAAKPFVDEIAESYNTGELRPVSEEVITIKNKLDPEKSLVTVGISCESCHLGGREHAIHQKAIRFLPTSKYVKLVPRANRDPLTSDRANARTMHGVCIQCHSGGGKRYPNGASKTNSSEARDFLTGFCTSKLRCVDCHEPHTAGQMSGLPDLKHHVDVCTNCHPKYSDPAAAKAHSRHSPSVNCLDCHMPKINQGLDDLVRSHRIMNPVEKEMVSVGSANACNTCHLDKSTKWTLAELKKGWGVDFEPNSSWKIWPWINQPLGEYWMAGADNHLRLMAIQNVARSTLGNKYFEQVLKGLNDPEPINRVFAGFAVQKLLGKKDTDPLPVNILAPPRQREQEIREFLKEFAERQKSKKLTSRK